jgi:hypothetical protein
MNGLDCDCLGTKFVVNEIAEQNQTLKKLSLSLLSLRVCFENFWVSSVRIHD